MNCLRRSVSPRIVAALGMLFRNIREYSVVGQVDREERGPLVRRIAGGREVRVSFDYRDLQKSYLLPAESLELFRYVVSLADSKNLPDVLDRHGAKAPRAIFVTVIVAFGYEE